MESGEESARRETGMGAMRAYELVRKELLTEFGTDFYRSYIEPLRLVAEWKGTILFKAGSAVARDRLRRQAQHRLEARMRAHAPACGPIEILLDSEMPEEVRDLAPAPANLVSAKPAATPGEHPLSYTFDHFCVDQTNFRAVTVAQMIASGAGMAFPVWLLHSAPGCGKTHLMNAIVHEASIKTPDRKVLMMTGQDFLENFQTAMHKKRDTTSFKETVRAPELLIIDEFQRICGKKATEEEALNTIANLTSTGRQVVLTADHGVDGLAGLDERLKRHLLGAATCEIQEPGQELRRRILEARMRHYARLSPGFQVAPQALDMIAEKMPVSGRELDGAIGQLVIESKALGGMEVSVDVAVNALQGKLIDSVERRVTVQNVQKVVARYFNMTTQQLLERTRRQSIARPRQIAMYLATRLTQASLPDIGQRFGGFDHTTIMYARDRIAELLETDSKMRQEVDTLIRLIRREP
jgi:chromosomal replication initiator protein